MHHVSKDQVPRCSVCGGSRIELANGRLGVCSFLECRDPLRDVKMEASRDLAFAWSAANDAYKNLTSTQEDCTRHIQSERAHKAKLKLARETLFATKFALEQGMTPTSLLDDIIKTLDLTT